MIKQILIAALLLKGFSTCAQTVLNADNIANNTYELINSVLAPGASSPAVETPDQVGVSANSSSGSHSSFGRHIQEVYDVALQKNVFAFYAHFANDNDVSTTSIDRQRIEIKTFGSSPANLRGTTGEIVQYKWRFKIPAGWQPSSSFTHIHQIKAVGGDDSDPIFTLTLRKGTSSSPANKIELIYDTGTNGSAIKKKVENLSLFEDTWVEATETITIGAAGTYSIDIKRVGDNVSLLAYSETNIETIRADNTFIRPKWGIYRSIATPSDLRDEVLYLSDISIQELNTLPVNLTSFDVKKDNQVVIINWQANRAINLSHYIIQKSINGTDFKDLTVVKYSEKEISDKYTIIDHEPALGINYYKLLSVDYDGTVGLNQLRSVNFNLTPSISIYPNPTPGKINFLGLENGDIINIADEMGRSVETWEYSGLADAAIDLEKKNGFYIITIERNKKIAFSSKLIKI